ncbi:MAG: aldehyde dehydrogenase family protein [Betaproteobacteria bacterium]|nr:aldehyde dehydrogenase family protein [Betaproteobacteria bacterium]
MMKALSALIAGQDVVSQDNLFQSLNPANNNDVVGTYASADKPLCRDACVAAREAFPAWSATPAPVRASVLQNFAHLIERNKAALAQLVTREMGKPIREALGDVQEAIDTCHFFVSEGRRLYGQTVPSEMPLKELFTYRRPVGVFACITAGNFPVAVPSWYFVPALLCGNTCVWKPSEDTPETSLAFYKLLMAAGIPKGVFNVVFGSGQITGAALVSLVDEGLIDKVGFTGSTEVGRQIGEICGRNLQSPCLELGGKNPLVVAEDANLEAALSGALWAAFGTAGQRCTSLGNLILHESVKSTFIKRLLEKVSELKIGDPRSQEIFYGPMISQKFLNTHIQNIETLVEKHHILLTPKNGRISSANDWGTFSGDAQNGCYAFPTIVDNVQKNDRIYKTETFGPLINVMTYSTLDEAILFANDTGYGLSSAIYTTNIETAYRFKTEIKAGMTSINNSTTGAEAHLPFGGNGKSGNGSRQSGVWVIDQFTRWQAVNWDVSGKLQLAQMETGYISPTDLILPTQK